MCSLVGIGERTYYDWIARGEDDLDAETNTPYSAFSQGCKEAQARAEEKALRVVMDAAAGGQKTTKTTTKRKYLVQEQPDPDYGPGNEDERRIMETDRVMLEEDVTTIVETTLPDARAAMWFLERRNRKEYGRTVGLTGADGTGPVQVQRTGNLLEQLDDDALDSLEAILASAAAGAAQPGGGAGGETPAGRET